VDARLALATVTALVLAAPNAAWADGEISLHVPIGVSVHDGARFELGLRADAYWRPGEQDLSFGLAGGVSELGWFDERRQEIGLSILNTPDVGRNIRMGLGFDAGVGSEPGDRFAYGRGSYQFRAAVLGDHYTYTCSSAIFLEGRVPLSGSSARGVSLGVELGGGFLLAALYALTAWVHD
jgi:hypothetical protein